MRVTVEHKVKKLPTERKMLTEESEDEAFPNLSHIDLYDVWGIINLFGKTQGTNK